MRINFLSKSVYVCLVIAILAMFSGTVFAQSDNGSISGFVRDPTGAIIPNANVTIRDEATGNERKVTTNGSGYYIATSLRPGLYKIDIVIKDVNNPDHIGTWRRSVNVPKYDDDKLSASSLILADEMFRVPSKEIGAGNFVIGNTHVRPRVPSGIAAPVTFHRAQSLNFWMQVYNLGIDEKSKQNGATIEYQVVNMGTNQTILQAQELTSKTNPNADQVTLERSLPLASLQPGKYQITIKVNDGISKQQIAESAPFVVD